MKVGLGGGCHWCTEGVFQALRGVTQVEQGFLQSEPPADTWAEGVVVTFDPSAISLGTLSEVHLRTHSSSRARSIRGKYRSAIYIFEPGQRSEAEQAVRRFAAQAAKDIHTQVMPFVGFLPSDERYQNYYRTDPSRPFCRRYIDPKLDLIRREYADIALTDVHELGEAPSGAGAHKGGC
ncbi:peptide-methionine (S)-S-oxide reductase [Sphingomonas sp. NPDC019816]|jgi:peptide-methionine (S)-S-oxide reductase|uniref:peptide-methionine (S)-S-oxide reductase n=1 Tax=Sphingobium naphthae TaxID=1886786 RepID=A0ABU4A1R2_9SPHN|nr:MULTISPECIES: peptide-methionine (S)-S-oxide reductase [Sphingobium]MBS0503134.1 peptide-methionine (S)-S-oxide reductase [Pseudomonadota bacterium]MDV5825689.1 peptide-methionine (S)-S-oxide reductase [Sphingobium naphthae]